MKKLIAFALALTMCLGMIVSVSAISPFAKKLALVKLIRTMFAKDDNEYEIGELDGGILTVYVAVNGKKDADGSKKNPYPTIEAARDAIREIDKTELDGIDVHVTSGTYTVDKTIEFIAEDGGTKDCPIRYIGEDNTVIMGGIAFDYTEFEKASGETLSLFPEAVRDKLYMYDLGKLGYTADDIAEMLKQDRYYNYIGLIGLNGKQMDIARYPNVDEGWIEIEGGYFLDKDGNYTENDGNNGGEDAAVQTIIEYGDEYMERVLSWKNREDLFVRGRFKFVWCLDDTEVTELYTDRDEMLLPFSGGYFPVENGLLFFYNIPEELDVPGEYYVDRAGMMYYYPTETFKTDAFTVPTLDGDLIKITDADWLTFDGLTLQLSLQNAITFNADNLTIRNCNINNFYVSGITGSGNGITIEGNDISNLGHHGIQISGGDSSTLTRSGNIICNNRVHEWATRGIIKCGITVEGCGSTICHNEVFNSTNRSINASGPEHLCEYNYVYDTCLFYCDEGAIRTSGYAYGTIVRYNVVINTGYESDLDICGVAGIISDGSGGNEIYGNIVYNSTGDSLLGAGLDRDVSFHHNLCIKPGREGLEFNTPEYSEYYNNNVYATANLPSYLFSDIWLEKYPTLKGVHNTYDPENPGDPMFYYAPVGHSAYNNYLVYDKAYETYPPMYDYMQGTVMYIENHAKTFSGDNIETFSAALGNYEQYSSKRNKNPQTIGDALAKANEAVGVIMTPEQLDEVGCIGVDYEIGNIIIN